MRTALAAAMMIAASPVAAQNYVSIHGGPSVWDCTANSCEVEAKRPGGYRVQAAIGRHLNERWAIEAELSWQSHEIHGINPGDGRTLSADGNTLHTVAPMLNIGYHLDTVAGFEPYVLAGLGAAYQMIDSGGERPLDDEMLTLAGQIGLGARYPVTDRWSLDARYVYWRALGTDVDAPAGMGNGLDLDHWSHNVLVGVVWAW